MPERTEKAIKTKIDWAEKEYGSLETCVKKE